MGFMRNLIVPAFDPSAVGFGILQLQEAVSDDQIKLGLSRFDMVTVKTVTANCVLSSVTKLSDFCHASVDGQIANQNCNLGRKKR